MKKILVLWLTGTLLAGCASPNNRSVLNPVGPAPSSAGNDQSATGILVVYSAYEVNADFNSRDPNRPEYSDYKIYSNDGKLLERVHNNSDTIFQDPRRVTMPAGSYRVVALSDGFGRVTIPVTIATSRTTMVRLEGNWSASYHFNDTNAVRLPDGQVVGYRSKLD